MSRLNSYSANAIKDATNVAIVYFPENVESSKYSIVTYNKHSGVVAYCNDGTGLMKPYPSRAKALDAIRRLNPDFNASNVQTITNTTWFDIVDFFKKGAFFNA